MLKHKSLKTSQVIKNNQTKELWLIVYVNTLGVYIVNLMLNYNPTPLLILMPRDYDNWEIADYVVDINSQLDNSSK